MMLDPRADQHPAPAHDSPRWCATCAEYGDHHTDRHSSAEPCACGHDETDHGAVIVGCIHCRNCDRYIPRSTYVSAEQDEDDEDCGHHSWAGLMSLLDEHWPDDIFPTRYEDDPKRDAGPRIVSLMRWIDELRAKVARVEALCDERERQHTNMGQPLFDGSPAPCFVLVARIRTALGGDA